MKYAHRGVAVILSLFVVALVINWASGTFFKPTETTVTELAPGVFFRKTQTKPEFIGCNQGWVEFKEFVLVIDANFPNQAEEVKKIIRKQTNKPIRYVFDTHYHGDHADGNASYPGATCISSLRSKALFETKGISGFELSQRSKKKEYGKLKYKTPLLYFDRKLVIDDGTQRVELLYFGHAHTMGDAVAWLPKHGIVFTGDAVVNGAFNYTGDSNTESWISVLNALQELPIKIIAPGHGERTGKELIATQRRYFVELRAEIKKLIAKKRTLDQIKKEVKVPFYKKWTGVDVTTRVENIEHVYSELTGKKKG